MTKKEYQELLQTEVYKDEAHKHWFKKHLLRLYNRNFIPQRRAVYLVRKMQYYYNKGGLWKYYGIYIQRCLWSEFACFISEKAMIGKGFHLPHPTGVVIGVAAHIGENVSLYQQVTIGGGRIGDAQKGNQPILGDNVICFAGSKVLGKVIIGNDVVIGANSLVIKDCESGATYVGTPARKVK